MSERTRVLSLLDELHAAESAGARAMERWVEVCSDPALRGGLRVILARDRAHATLAEARLRALGGTPERTPSAALARLLDLVAAPDVADAMKLAAMIGRVPSDRGDPISNEAAGIVNDRETRALVETMADDDRVSVAWLRHMAEPRQRATADPGASVRATAAVLDAVAAAEAASATVFEAWQTACGLDGLRGGLTTIAARESTHAALLEARLAEIGGPAEAAVPAASLVRAVERYGDAAITDETKLDAMLRRYPDDAGAGHAIAEAGRAASDPETAEMLGLIAGGEQATIAWLRAYRRTMARPVRVVGS